MEKKTIYKKDNKGKIRILTVWTEGPNLYRTSGLEDGKQVEHHSVCEAKNVGRANATTSEEQAVVEATAIITKKLSQDYFETKQEAMDAVLIQPMTAKIYKDRKNSIDWTTAYVQPKLDGMRCLDFGDKKMSRGNKEIETVNHIENNTEYILDGELYAHGYNFQQNMKMIKKYRPQETEKVKHHVYDIVIDKPFSERLQLMKQLKEEDKCNGVLFVPTFKVNNEDDVKMMHKKFLAKGYEGTMLRHGTQGYESGVRSNGLLKYKDFQDIAVKIINVIPNIKNPEQGTFVCEYKGNEFKCGMKYSHEDRRKILEHKEKYIGQTAEIRFFEYSEDGIPRFPVCVGTRLDK